MEETSGIIYRPLYMEKIKPFIGKNLIKVITGQRRVGKSYILKSIIEDLKGKNPDMNFIYLNLEDFAFSHIKDYEDLYREITSRLSTTAKNCILIDEIQEVKDFEKTIRSLNLDDKNDIYITGSNSKMLSSELSTLLAGRTYEMKIHPLTYKEFLYFHNKKDSEETIKEYLQYGGLPFLIHLPDSKTWNEYLSGVADAIIYRDIVSRHSLRNNDFLQRLLLFVADNIGQLFTAKRITDYLKSQKINSSVTGVQNYISYLEEALVLNKVRRWDIDGKRFFEIGEKLFFEDLGIRNSIIGYRPQDISGLLENAVYNQLTATGHKVKVGVGEKDREIDFVAEKDGEIKYIQVALSLARDKTMEREFGNLEAIKDNYEKLVITYRDSYPNSHNGIKAISLREFLLMEE